MNDARHMTEFQRYLYHCKVTVRQIYKEVIDPIWIIFILVREVEKSDYFPIVFHHCNLFVEIKG